MTLYEVNEAASVIRETAHEDVNLIFGAVIDEAMGDEVRITVIATGFDQDERQARREVAVVRREPKEIVAPSLMDRDNIEIPAFLRRRA
jgi:cell division protein FtsZ